MFRAPLPLTLRQLQYLVAVAERQSFRRAAEDCHVSQPSLSAQVALAEVGLGVRLFERDRRRVVLTHAGEVLLPRARAVLLSAVELVDASLQLGDPLAGALRVGVIPTVAPYLLPEVAPALRERYPKLHFQWTEEKTVALVQRIARGELDGAIVALESELGELVRLQLGKDPFVLAMGPSHRLAGPKRPVQAEDLEGERVLLLDDGHCFRDQALAFCARAGLAESSFRATSLATLAQMAAGGEGVTLLPRLALDVENRRGALVLRSFAKPPQRTLVLAWRKGTALEVALRAVGESLRGAYAELLNPGRRPSATGRS